MLAHPLKDVLKHTWYPCSIQSKLNGVRLIVEVKNGKVTLWSRKRTRITGLPHIQKGYEQVFKDVPGTFVFDGECYRHGWPLQKISGFCRSKEPKDGYWELWHYVYDMPSVEGVWTDRRDRLQDFYDLYLKNTDVCSLVTSQTVSSEDEAWELHDLYVKFGYEGAILRQFDYTYEFGKRSQGLAKLKKFQDAEFLIVGCNEGVGKFAGCAVFTCKTDEGKTFECCAPGSLEERAKYFQNKEVCVGKQLTVRYFELSTDNIPIFPVGVCIRDYE
jgi:DNA ligase-1